LSVKFNLILSCALILLFLGTAFLTYRDQKEVAQKIALDQGRSATRELVATFNHMSDIVRDEPETNYALVPQVVATQIAKKISAKDHYSIRQVSLNFRNPDNRPDSYEAEQLKVFSAENKSEIYRITQNQGKEVFRYMKALAADESCLKCHGTFESAPEFIQQRFPREHPSYNYQPGEIIGAVSVVRPMAGLYRDVASNLKQTFYYRAWTLVLVVVVTWVFVRKLIIMPVQSASDTIHHITTTGDLHERIPVKGPQDEIGQLLIDFNTMMGELDRTTLQRRESEDRYRNLIEAAESAIVTFLENGKIIISNQQAEQLIGLSRSDLLGESVFEYFEDNDRLKATLAALSQTDKKHTSRYMFRAASGDIRDMEITLVLASAVDNAPMFTAILRSQK